MKNSPYGHSCPGMGKFLSAVTSQCDPTIDEDGEISGCDASNKVRVKFCPFCGAGFNCPNCDQPVLPHDRRDCCYTYECEPHWGYCGE